MLLQLTDSHLLQDPQARMFGVNTDASLRAVLDLARRQEGSPDLMLLTGDLAQDGSAAAYQRLRAHLRDVAHPVRCVMGNHDAAGQMRQQLSDWSQPVHDLPGWRIIMLDSTVPGQDFGHIDAGQFALLDQALREAGERHVLVALHHNLARVEGAEHDTLMVDNAAAVFARLSDHPQARVALWGHIHQEFDCRHHHLRMLGTPSTSFQFRLDNGHYAVDPQAPGYRWLKLYADGSIATGVRRLDAATWAALRDEPLPLESAA
ncbi:metallophosphoesterase [Bordetella holmesii]|uniref:metallophosphoesterase n=1 Tax=Bordetella holmesii TaxID=35814 RepID=UPI0002BB6271|nr:metallophosphoesterase [Bordetella holmesii]AMD47284.1 3',5'-cyclic-nucleotide phosphodiesterase [Bordetella holmesii H558]AMD49255.1 3',5'-cyclic-nucleotide phosphodiesterase [Bordetella holmesii F627]AOB34203.1 phosphodiesterase [Bordetella holmesii]AUL18221.1 phosphodiesterase [Bordetella holmesii]AUL21534.1 phosphodiesterase [Bordetella holmesii]